MMTIVWLWLSVAVAAYAGATGRGPMRDTWREIWRGVFWGWLLIPFIGLVILTMLVLMWPLHLVLILADHDSMKGKR